jgi:uncharacterized NAD(P)/FAD-binding protein YdhS
VGLILQPINHSIIAELEDAVTSSSSERRIATLRQVTDLFLYEGERLNDGQAKVFDDVLCLLVARVETRARAELGKRPAPIDYDLLKPFEVIQHLARDDEIAVAGSVLTSADPSATLRSFGFCPVFERLCRRGIQNCDHGNFRDRKAELHALRDRLFSTGPSVDATI